MLTQDYQSNVARIREKYNTVTTFDNGDITRQYNIVSAALTNFLPEVSFVKHHEIFRDILFHQHLSNFDQDKPTVLENCQLENFSQDLLTRLQTSASIICTFHLGSYRLLNLFLATNKVPFSLVVSENVVREQGKLFDELHERFGAGNISLIAAEAPNSALAMMKELKKGRNLLIYIDGNTGSGDATLHNDNGCSISFLNQRIVARKGIGFLAHAAGVPVLPAICYRPSELDVRIRFFDLIMPDKSQERTEFAHALVQRIYDIASPFIKQYPEQWEAWLYLPKVTQVINKFPRGITGKWSLRSSAFVFNSMRFGLFKTSKRPYLFDKESFVSYPIASSLYATLLKAISDPVDKSSFEAKIFDELYKNEVLICDV